MDRAIDFRYEPRPGEDLDRLLDKARTCGADLDPKDRRSAWIDTHPEREALLSEYHEGQGDQFERAAFGEL
jgi:hypothetical protein